MGTQACSQSQREKSFILQNSLKVTAGNHDFQTGIQIKQQCDNPSRGVIFKCLNNQPLSASNDLLNKTKKKQCVEKSQKSLIFNEIKQQNSQKSKNKTQTKSRRCSIVNSFLAQIAGNSNNWSNVFTALQNENMQSIKSFIISEKNLYESYLRAEIKLQDFIKLKKAPIRKNYIFQQKIGEGSYGNVYKATCVKTKQVRAVKSIKQKMMSKNQKNEFILEMDVLRQLDHPNIIKLFEVFQDLSMYHVVTQYCVGGSIIDFAVTRKKYSEKIVRTIFEQVLSSINYIHLLKIVHRDLKLQNLVFLNSVNQDTDAKEIDVKLIDFGTAVRLKKSVNVCHDLVGTTSYMAPQIIDGYYNQKCDVWSAGIILYILLVGKSPFKCTKKEDTLQKIQNYELTFREPQWGNISKLAIDLLDRMLNKDPEKRISASKALSHDWFKQVRSGTNMLFQNKHLVQNLSKYYRGNNFISKIQSYLTFVKVSQEERKKISQMFRLLDKNNDGTIQVQELKAAYHAFNDEQNMEQLEYIVSKIDKNKSGKIDLSEFTAAIYDKRKLFVKEYLVEAFEYFDSDGTGYIQKQELHQLLQGCEEKEIEQILKQIDSNGDHKISKEEFLDYLLRRNFLFSK